MDFLFILMLGFSSLSISRRPPLIFLWNNLKEKKKTGKGKRQNKQRERKKSLPMKQLHNCN